MNETVRGANSKVLLNPRDAPAAVRSSNEIAMGVVAFRDRLGIESGDAATDAKRWRQAVGEAVDKVRATGTEGVATAKDKTAELKGVFQAFLRRR